jgi:hypothetical protein
VEQIRRWGRGLKAAVTLRYALCGHAMDAAVRQFAELLAAASDHVRLKKERDTAVPLPTLFAGDRVTYQALPLERELEPFLAALTHGGSAYTERIPPRVRQRLGKLQAPAQFKVYVTSQCPHCPLAVATLLGLAGCSPLVRVTVIDGERFAEVAQADRVTAAPTVILDDTLRWTGTVNPDELVTLVLDRDPANLGADALRRMIEGGDAGQLATMMAARGKLFPAFFDLLTHPRWSVRLGAMVTFETLAETDALLAGQAIAPLTARFDDVDDTVKGDLLHVLGEAGNPAVRPFLDRVIKGAYDDEVRAAAREAIDKLT